MTTNGKSRSNCSVAWLGRTAAGTCVAILMAVTAAGQVRDEIQDQAEVDATALNHPIPSPAKRSYSPASVQAFPGLQCSLYPEGSAPSSGLTVFTDDDGYARFHAVRAAAGDKVQRLTLDCKDAAGGPAIFSVDLTSDDTFAPRPLNLANERGTDRPALIGDPVSYSQTELIQAGYGLRPDPEESPEAYARWLESALTPGRILEAKRPNSSVSHTVKKPTPGCCWVGSVLGGSPNYISVEGNFNVPTAIPGGDETTGTEISIWNGLGGYNTGSGLIQAGVNIQTGTFTAAYGSWREFCCGPGGDSNGYGGAFTPNPGDKIYDQNWYCDAAGNANIAGGYGCNFVHDLTTGAILSCTSPSGSPCWSAYVHSGMTLGVDAEFVIENQDGGCCKPSTAFTDYSPEVTFTGTAYSSKTGKFSQTISSDSLVYLLEDFTKTTSHMKVSLGKTNQTYFSMSQFVGAGGVTANAKVIDCGNSFLCFPESIAVGPNAEGSNIGDAWVIEGGATNADQPIYRWEKSKWVKQTGIAGVLIAVSPKGVPWVVNRSGEIRYFDGSAWDLAPGKGCATSIAVGPNAFGSKYGDPWIIGCDGGYPPTNGTIYQLQGSKWVKQTGAATQIAIGNEGIPWTIDNLGNIYYFDGSKFMNVPGCATSIAVAPDGATYYTAVGVPWITGCTAEGSGYGIYQWQGGWAKIPGSATEIAVSPDLGVPWIVNDKGQVSR